jgi:hypothetical protein
MSDLSNPIFTDETKAREWFEARVRLAGARRWTLSASGEKQPRGYRKSRCLLQFRVAVSGPDPCQ